ncbi:PAH2 domain-containing protein [Dendrothele bispora CBS 962.96]|uniref:PAH2 domain-containing protein n=1 Tax=Dendrothele bispora (strain CBS 962.96) TaxID=1314807 RepID=A0A4S8KNI3_DENBC|nr:PAH2 domain-containing protein [Dendrothele bispora CBS 962.96]
MPNLPPSGQHTRENCPVLRPASHMSFLRNRSPPRTPIPMAPGPLVAETNNVAAIPGSIQHSLELSQPERLNVTEAGAYLDAVKIQFQDKPEVYRVFLDIMKDFKDQKIGTSGLIQQVSRLFHGNPPLIQGFNVFLLPIGDRIDVSDSPVDDTITVTIPTGTTMHSTNNLSSREQHSRRRNSETSPGDKNTDTHYTADNPRSNSAGTGSPIGSSQSLGSINGDYTQQHNRRTDQELFRVNDAVGYPNAVKDQFYDNLEVYTKFLDAMQDFKSKQIDISGFIQRLSHLFQGNPNLLQGINAFLPDGYRIDVSMDETITVTTPTSTMIHSTNDFSSGEQHSRKRNSETSPDDKNTDTHHTPDNPRSNSAGTESPISSSRNLGSINGGYTEQDDRRIDHNIENYGTYYEGDYTVNNIVIP